MTLNFCCKNSRSMTKRKNVFLMTDLGLKEASIKNTIIERFFPKNDLNNA